MWRGYCKPGMNMHQWFILPLILVFIVYREIQGALKDRSQKIWFIWFIWNFKKKSLFSCLKSKIKSLKENLFNSFKLIFCANKTLCEEEKTFQIHLLEGSTWITRWLNLVTQLLILVCFVSVFTQYLSFHIC